MMLIFCRKSDHYSSTIQNSTRYKFDPPRFFNALQRELIKDLRPDSDKRDFISGGKICSVARSGGKTAYLISIVISIVR